MHTAFISTDTIVIDKPFIIKPAPAWNEIEEMLPETVVPVKRSFGIIDLWNIRNRKKYFSIYRKYLY